MIPFGVSIYLDLNIRETVEGCIPNSSDNSLLVRGLIFNGFSSRNDICFLQMSSPTSLTVSFLFLTDDSNHLAS